MNATVPNGTEALYVATKDQKALELKGDLRPGFGNWGSRIRRRLNAR